MSFTLRYFIICFFSFAATALLGQDQDWMIPPVKHKVRLAGTFGELRNNHFHTGVDIKSSNGQVGDVVMSVADGFVSRIKISSTGYGNCLYIDHPNGYTTVYAHLHKLDDAIADLVELSQYNLESFEIDTTLSPELLPLKQGDVIGMMGNSGRSYGPHLHFEIRETKSEIPYNPLSHGVEITDNVPPEVSYMTLNFLDSEQLKRGSKKVWLKKSGKIFKPANSLIKVPAWRTGVSLFTRDLMTGVSNKNGIYSAKLLVDQQEVFSFHLDSISFDDFRYLNAHIDYDHYKSSKHRLHQLYRKKGNLIPIYKETEDQVIKLYAEKARDVRIEVSDIHGNISAVEFQLIRDTTMAGYKEKAFQYFLEFGSPHIINQEDVKFKFAENTFYEDYYLSVETTAEKETNYVSSVYHIGEKNTAIHRMFDLYIRHNIVDSVLLSKVFVASCDNNKYYSYGGEILDDLVGTKVKTLGAYVLMIDTIPPTIDVVSAPAIVKKGSRLRFKIDDNIAIKGRAKDLTYNAYIDDQWILMSFDMKSKTLTHFVDDRWTKGKHSFRLEIRDDRNNVSVYRKEMLKN